MSRHFRHIAMFAIIAGALLSAPVISQGQENVPAAGRFEREINDTRNVAEEGRQMIAQLEFSAKEAGDVAADDIAQAKVFFDTYVKRWTEIGELFEQDKPDEARKQMSAARASVRGRDRWRERIGIRTEQIRTAPTTEMLRREKTSAGADTRAALFNNIERSKAVSEAWGKLADSMTPEASEDSIRMARQAVNAANSERDIAGAQFNWSREAADLNTLRSITTEMDASLRALETVQDQMIENMRAKVELERRMDDTEAARRAALDTARKAADAARKVKEEAERAK